MPSRIVYPGPWIGDRIAQIVRSIIAESGPSPVELVSGDSSRYSDGYAADIEYAEMTVALPGAAIVIGPQSSRATLLVAGIYEDHGLPIISATATNHLIDDIGPWVFQLAPSDVVEGRFIARFARERLDARRVTVFYLIADEYGVGLRDGIENGLQDYGVVIADQVAIIVNSDFPTRVAQSLQRARPDAVVIAARGPEAIAIVNALRQLAVTVPVILGDGAPLDTVFYAATGPNSENVYGAAWWHPDLPDSASRSFLRRYRRNPGGSPTAADAMYFDALMLAAGAVRAAGGDRRGLRDYLHSLGRTRPPYQGITGPIHFQPDRPVNLIMTRFRHGRNELVWRPEPAS